MTATRLDRTTLRAAIALANRPPSMHNSQPWRWRIGAAGAARPGRSRSASDGVPAAVVPAQPEGTVPVRHFSAGELDQAELGRDEPWSVTASPRAAASATATAR